jgi:RNA polymerase sigma-70 factor (ECF subfamily)
VDVIISGELHDNIVMILNKLNPIYRYVLVMKYVNDYSLKEIAKVISRTPKAVDGILQRGKASFIKQYKKLLEVEVNE